MKNLLLFSLIPRTYGFLLPHSPRNTVFVEKRSGSSNFGKNHRSLLHLSSSDQNESNSIQIDGPAVSIEYCTGCRWLLRSAWLMQELFTTFDQEMGSITLVPSKPPSPGGTFLVSSNNNILWDRRADNGFPEAKQLKQRVRDEISPNKDLGHSDTTAKTAEKSNEGDCVECEEEKRNETTTKTINTITSISALGPDHVVITYCAGCRWMLRASWICQELLTTFEQELGAITLVPSRPPAPGGTFTITIGGEVIWDRKEDGGFPEVKELKQRVRDTVSPDRNLGHIDGSASTTTDLTDDTETEDDEFDDEDAAEMRSFYGVL